MGRFWRAIPRGVGRGIAGLAPLLRAGLICGIALAALLFPLVAVAGLGAIGAAAYVERLPSQLTSIPPAQVSYLYASDGKTLITQFFEEYRRYVPLAQISTNVQQAIVAS